MRKNKIFNNNINNCIELDLILVIRRTTKTHFLVVHSHFLGVEDTWTRRFSYPVEGSPLGLGPCAIFTLYTAKGAVKY